MNQQQWISRLKELHDAHRGSQFSIGDHVNIGIQAFGRTEAFDAAQQITGTKHTRNFFTRCAAVASYFKPELRFPKLSFHTYEVLARFPIEFLTRFIPEVAESGRSCAQLYALAVERYGSDPRRPKRLGKTHKVKLPEKIFCSLSARASSPDKTHLLIVKILEDWLGEPQSAEKASIGACPSSVPKSDDTEIRSETRAEESTPRPSYSERREAQKVNDDSDPRKFREPRKDKKYASKVEIAFTECKGQGKDFVDSEQGAVQFRARVRRADSFRNLPDALKAAQEYSLDRGYCVVPFVCKNCSNGRPIWHLRAAAEVDLSQEQAEIRVTVQDFIQSTRASLRETALTA